MERKCNRYPVETIKSFHHTSSVIQPNVLICALLLPRYKQLDDKPT